MFEDTFIKTLFKNTGRVDKSISFLSVFKERLYTKTYAFFPSNCDFFIFYEAKKLPVSQHNAF